ncbi:MAG: DUF1015 family protein [Saprospiraceae bacterium]
MNIKPFQYLHPDYKKISKTLDFFDQVKNTFPDLRKEEIYVESDQKAIFVYRIKSATRTYQGILAAVDIHDYLKGHIKKHENTLTLQEENISNLMKNRSAIIKPVLIAYNEQKKIKDLLTKSFDDQKATFKIFFEKDQQIHEFYEITDKKWIALIQKEFKTKIKKAYIADGHHRMAAVCKFILQNPELSKRSLNYIMCALFDFNELSIMPYNRLIKALDLMSLNDFILMLRKYALVTKLKKSRLSNKKNELILITKDLQYVISWHKEVLQYFKQKNGIAFDIDIFNELILRDMLGIQNIRSNDRIQHIEGIKNMKIISKLVLENSQHLGFLFYPVKKSDFIKVADEHMVLPPKSTWFEPRIKNGIIVQELNLELIP